MNPHEISRKGGALDFAIGTTDHRELRLLTNRALPLLANIAGAKDDDVLTWEEISLEFIVNGVDWEELATIISHAMVVTNQDHQSGRWSKIVPS